MKKINGNDLYNGFKNLMGHLPDMKNKEETVKDGGVFWNDIEEKSSKAGGTYVRQENWATGGSRIVERKNGESTRKGWGGIKAMKDKFDRM